MSALLVWRHPKPTGVQGRCIGHTDVAVDPRKAKRLAHRVRRLARLERAPRVIWTSPLARCAAVGWVLANWGWTHHTDPRLSELNFGAWDGQAWSLVPLAELDQWTDAFADHAPGGGESLRTLMQRCAAFVADHPNAWVIGHAGWINAAKRVVDGLPPPERAADWPPSPPYATLWRARSSLGAESQ